MQVLWKSAARTVASTSRYLSLNHCGELRVGPEHVQMGCGAFLRRLQLPVRDTGRRKDMR